MNNDTERRDGVIRSAKGPMTVRIGDWVADEAGRGGELVRMYSDLDDHKVLLDVQTAEGLVITLKENLVTFCQGKGE